MSGGVDSSVAAYLMLAQGYDCLGATMRLLDNRGSDEIASARAICERLGISFHEFDLAEEFRAAVIDKFVAVYQGGGTPNPCIDCNRHLKFGELLKRASAIGADKIATGHYVRVTYDENRGRYLLKKAIDEMKDQSYFLYTLTQSQLSRVAFPLGEYRKPEIRTIAAAQGFGNADKSDSQDICFIPDGDYAAFIEEHSGVTCPQGDFVDTRGNVLGRHNGVIRYTVGQRRGLGLALPYPMYVSDKNALTNTVTLCDDVSALCVDCLTADEFNWIAFDAPAVGVKIQVKAKFRYNQREQNATAVVTDSGRVSVVFDEPQRAVARGQAVVLYDDDTVVGGGVVV